MVYNNQACDNNVYSSFQHVFGQPGHILSPDTMATDGPISSIHTEAFMKLMSWNCRQARPLPNNNPYVDKKLDSCNKVWVQNSVSHNNVAPLYLGPFEVVSRTENYFVIKQDNYLKCVSVDRNKAFFKLSALPPPTRYHLRSLGDRSQLKKIDEDFVTS